MLHLNLLYVLYSITLYFSYTTIIITSYELAKRLCADLLQKFDIFSGKKRVWGTAASARELCDSAKKMGKNAPVPLKIMPLTFSLTEIYVTDLFI